MLSERNSLQYYVGIISILVSLFTMFIPAASVFAAQLPKTVVLKTVGNKIETASGRTYVPEGISMYGGLEDTNYNEYTQNDDAQILAAAKYWHANTIRFQVAESNLFKHVSLGKSYNTTFLAAVKKQVDFARSLHTAVVINDQTEFTSRIPGPTQTTVRFWNIMAQTFGSDPDVIFDLFNEPRIANLSGLLFNSDENPLFHLLDKPASEALSSKHDKISPATVWHIWKYGGTINSVSYVGMQSLVNDIRERQVSNLIWVEGPYMARMLPPSKDLLTGSNIIYSIHHPNLNKPSSWKAIGKLAKIRPVVDGEWAQYESLWPECYSEAYATTPKYLNYLHKQSIGIIAWSLQQDSLLQGSDYRRPTNTNVPSDPTQASDLRKPNSMTADYSCDARSGEGAGQQVMTYFNNYGQRYSPFTG
jgi:hypothetical protein